MKRSDFAYTLPPELIAKHPLPNRSDSRLLVVPENNDALVHAHFVDLLGYLTPGDLLVLNDTKVIPARLFAHKESGGKVEILIERVLDSCQVLAHVKASKSPKPGSKIVLQNQQILSVVERSKDMFVLAFDGDILSVIEEHGHMPLPPYIDREDEKADRSRYQTVYGREEGAVAAPTAGLHFDQDLLEAIEAKGIQIGRVTLHVGAGTFQPVRTEDIREHAMHAEWMRIDQSLCTQIEQTKAAGRSVIAVGTTSVRCLETAAQKAGERQLVSPYQGDTDIFIYPGIPFRVVDRLITNFHLPESTLMMLVSAFSGYERIMYAYREAIAQRYRFFSYGDAMLLSLNPEAQRDLPPSCEALTHCQQTLIKNEI